MKLSFSSDALDLLSLIDDPTTAIVASSSQSKVAVIARQSGGAVSNVGSGPIEALEELITAQYVTLRQQAARAATYVISPLGRSRLRRRISRGDRKTINALLKVNSGFTDRHVEVALMFRHAGDLASDLPATAQPSRDFAAACDAIGLELASAAICVCVDGHSLTDLEAQFGWPARAGKAILAIALDGLGRHYQTS